jgi:hypothetical protein
MHAQQIKQHNSSAAAAAAAARTAAALAAQRSRATDAQDGLLHIYPNKPAAILYFGYRLSNLIK